MIEARASSSVGAGVGPRQRVRSSRRFARVTWASWLVALLLAGAVFGCQEKTEEAEVTRLLEDWQAEIRRTRGECRLTGRAMTQWLEIYGESLAENVEVVSERAESLDAEERADYLSQLVVEPNPEAREIMATCQDHPKVEAAMLEMRDLMAPLLVLE